MIGKESGHMPCRPQVAAESEMTAVSAELGGRKRSKLVYNILIAAYLLMIVGIGALAGDDG
jgi:hypothetical protein